MAAGIDDLCVRQNDLDERNVQPVFWKFVDKARSICPSLDHRSLDILPAKSKSFAFGQAAQNFDVIAPAVGQEGDVL